MPPPSPASPGPQATASAAQSHPDQAVESQYDRTERTASLIAAGKHRNLIGGQWDVMGDLQLDFLRRSGLMPEHRVLDIGCGCLRAGVKLIPYLEPDHYYGLDAEKALLDVGFHKELARAGIQDRLSRANLYASRLFIHRRLGAATIDMAICNSVMTHLPLNYVRICLENTFDYFKDGASLFMTFFELPAGTRFSAPHTNTHGVTTNGASDPYHYPVSDMVHAAEGTGWAASYIGEWGHPRGQAMMHYRRA